MVTMVCGPDLAQGPPFERACRIVTANPKLHKSDNCTKRQEAELEFVYVHRGGCVGVAQISILCKTQT